MAVAWSLLLGAVHGEPPWAWAGAVVAVAVAFEGGRRLTGRHPLLVPTVVVATGLVVAIVGAVRGDLLDQLEGPLGYANATAALATTVVAAALVVRVRSRRAVVRAAALLVVAAAALVPWAVFSRMGTLAVLVVLVGALPWWRRVRPRRLVAAVEVGVVAAATTVVVVGLFAVPAARALGVSPGPLPVSLTERVRLWRRALSLFAGSPLVGVGGDGFVAGPPPAVADWERYAHAEPLQLAATGGLPALALLLVAVWWLLRTAARHPGDAALPIGLALLLAVGAHATADYVGHASLVRLALAAMLGTTLAAAGPPTRPPTDRAEVATPASGGR